MPSNFDLDAVLDAERDRHDLPWEHPVRHLIRDRLQLDVLLNRWQYAKMTTEQLAIAKDVTRCVRKICRMRARLGDVDFLIWYSSQ